MTSWRIFSEPYERQTAIAIVKCIDQQCIKMYRASQQERVEIHNIIWSARNAGEPCSLDDILDVELCASEIAGCVSRWVRPRPDQLEEELRYVVQHLPRYSLLAQPSIVEFLREKSVSFPIYCNYISLTESLRVLVCALTVDELSRIEAGR